MTGQATSVDPVTFEVVKHRLWQINDEQANAIKTISASPIVVEGNDYNVGLFTRDTQLVSAGSGSLVHVTTMGDALVSMVEGAGVIREGDAFLTNDPFLGALHQNDMVLAGPLFRDGQIFMWAANVLHHADVGGIDAGSFCINARTIFEDPPRFFVKLLDQGRLVGESEHTLVSNSRLPDSMALDLRAQVGALNVARERLTTLLDERGDRLVETVMNQSIDTAERQVRNFLRSLPNGSWRGEAYMDGVRVGDDSLRQVALDMTCEDDHVHFDYTGSSRQVEAAVNCTLSATVAGSVVPLYAFLCQGDIDWNDGLKRCVSVTAPEGTVVNAHHPVPVSISTVGFRWLVTVAASQAVARMFSCSDDHRDRACPSWNVSSNCNFLYAQFPDGHSTGALLSDHRGSGAGARSFADGFHHGGTITSYASNIGNVEGTEWKLPVRYLYRRRLRDSGGPGRFRGGTTSEAALTPYGIDRLALKSTNTAGTEQSNAHGIEGGFPGAGSQVAIVRDLDPDCLRGSIGTVPAVTDMPGRVTFLPSKADEIIHQGDLFVFWAAGGGGFGDPIDRPPEEVASDLREGVISSAIAESLYGVVLDQNGMPLTDQSNMRRSEIRHERRHAEQVMPSSEALRCHSCGETGPFRATLHPLSYAGPWMALRHQGDGPNFQLTQICCRSCGTLLDTRETLRHSDRSL